MRFREEYEFLSNFYPAQIELHIDKGTWWFPTAENAYQACKSENVMDWLKIATMNPMQAKRYGRTIKLRDNWDVIKLKVMTEIVTRKFEQHPDLMVKLVATGNMEIIEENFWGDTYWGVCDGKGQNKLGEILMLIRFLNREEEKVEKS